MLISGPSPAPTTGLRLRPGLTALPSMSTLTVFLTRQLQHHVLLAQFVIDLLQVFDVVDGLPQNARFVHLGGRRVKTQQHQFRLHSEESGGPELTRDSKGALEGVAPSPDAGSPTDQLCYQDKCLTSLHLTLLLLRVRIRIII